MSLNEGFNDRMQRAKDAALAPRNRGFSERRGKSWAKPPLAEDTPENRLYAELAELRRDVPASQIRSTTTHGVPSLIAWRAKKRGPGCRPIPMPLRHTPQPARKLRAAQ